jgi:hypothetical protein
MKKTCVVVGPRMWRAGVAKIAPSGPTWFTRLPISYDFAFGGTDCRSDDASQHDAYAANPVGRGWHKHLKASWVDGQPLPTTERPGQPVRFPSKTYEPIAFGPVGRGWPQRARYAGTYDARWLDEVSPFLPQDFDERYHQSAPPDQQIPLPRAQLDVELDGFFADGRRQFVLPSLEAPVHVFPRRGKREDHLAQLDTIVFEPDDGRLTMTWRVTRPLKKSLHEIAQILVGRKGREWWLHHEQSSFPVPVVALPADRSASR